jgi:hypothetical protein
MKRLLITLSAFCILFADISDDLVGQWKLSGLKVDYLHIARETVPVTVKAEVNPAIEITLQTIPAGALYNVFQNGPFTLGIIDNVNLNLNVNLWPDLTGYIAEGSFYPDIDLVGDSCITEAQIFPVTDEFVWELGGPETFASTNIIGGASSNALAGAGTNVYGFGVAQSGTFDGWPSVALPERVPAGLAGIAQAENDGSTTYLAYGCSGWCAGPSGDGSDGAASSDALPFGGSVTACVQACSGWDYATAGAYSGGVHPGWLTGSGSSGYIAVDQGLSQMPGNVYYQGANAGDPVPVDLLMEWNAIDGVTSQSGIDIDDEDGDGDATEFNRIFGIPYVGSTYVKDTPECDITGGEGLNLPIAGDIIAEIGGSACGTAANNSGGTLSETDCDEAAVAQFLTGGCLSTVEGLCNDAGDSVIATATATCESYASIDSQNTGGLFVVLYAGCLGDCFDPTGVNDTCGDEAHGACAAAAGQGVGMYGTCAGWASASFAAGDLMSASEALAYGGCMQASTEGVTDQCNDVFDGAVAQCVAGGVDQATCEAGVNAGNGGAAGAFVSYFAGLQLDALAAAAGVDTATYVAGGCATAAASDACAGDEVCGAGGFAQELCLGFNFSESACGFDADDPDTDENEQGLANLVMNSGFTSCAELGANVSALTAAAGGLVDTADESSDNNCDEWAPTVADGFAELANGVTCTALGQANAGNACDDATWADGFAQAALGESCTDYGNTFIADCVIMNPLNETGHTGNTAGALEFYVMDLGLATWGYLLTANAAAYSGYAAAGLTDAEILATYPSVFVNDSDHDFNPETGTGRLDMLFEPTCVDEIEARQITAEFVGLDELCAGTGDATGDGLVDVQDIVRIVGHILGSDNLGPATEDTNGDGVITSQDQPGPPDGVPDLLGGYGRCNADTNADGIINVADIVSIVSTVLGTKSADMQDATKASILVAGNEVSIAADGFVGGVQMLVEHTEDLEIEFSNNFYVGGIEPKGDNTSLILFVGSANVTDVFTVTQGKVTSILESTISGMEEILNVTVEQPADYVISNAYPNPFNPSTTISLELNTSADLSVKVYNLMGQLVDVVAEGSYSPNTYNWTWNAENLASGVYFIKTQVGSDVSAQKVMLLK